VANNRGVIGPNGAARPRFFKRHHNLESPTPSSSRSPADSVKSAYVDAVALSLEGKEPSVQV